MPRGDIVLVDLPVPGIGHEQYGQRPALVIYDDQSQSPPSIITVIPFTGNMAGARFAHTIAVKPSAQNGLSQESVLLLFQLRAIDRSRVRSHLGHLETSLQQIVDAKLKAMLGL